MFLGPNWIKLINLKSKFSAKCNMTRFLFQQNMPFQVALSKMEVTIWEKCLWSHIRNCNDVSNANRFSKDAHLKTKANVLRGFFLFYIVNLFLMYIFVSSYGWRNVFATKLHQSTYSKQKNTHRQVPEGTV